MDVASTVYGLATGIVNFISEHQSKVDLEKQIANVVVQIQIAISPLLLRKSSSEGINHCVRSLQNVLGSVDKHLREWKDSRRRQLFALVHPWTYTQVLKDDRDELMRQYVLLTGAMHVVDHLKAYSVLPSPQHQRPKLQRLEKQNPREEVAQFWQLKIGGEMEIVRTALLCERLEQWIKKTLGDVGRNGLRLRLDEHNTGYVTLKSFQEFARDMTLKDAVRLYCADPQFPLLVWISDDLKVNASKVAYAQARGVLVVQISSTKTAKAWIKVNKSLLKAHDSPRSLRFVSDQNRYELHRNGTVILNNEAGEQIMKFIREEGIYAPILILTSGQSIHLTRYVESYDMTGSVLWDGRGYYDFAAALGARRKSDRIWMGYGGRYPDGRPL